MTTRNLTVDTPQGSRVVEYDADTQIFLSDGSRGSASDLTRGVIIAVVTSTDPNTRLLRADAIGVLETAPSDGARAMDTALPNAMPSSPGQGTHADIRGYGADSTRSRGAFQMSSQIRTPQADSHGDSDKDTKTTKSKCLST